MTKGGSGYRIPLVAGLLTVTSACAVVDHSFPIRNDASNHGYDIAGNDEILTNIARASHSQPLRFYQHTKFLPSQTSDLKLGLPTLTLGPGQTIAQRQFVFGNNLFDNSAAISYEIDPIETKEFHSGILTPLSRGQVGVLLTQFPRELIFFLLFESVRISTRLTNSQGHEYDFVREYRNLPTLDNPAACPDFDYSMYDPTNYAPGAEDSPYHPGREAYEGKVHNCNFHKFQFYVEEAIKYGVTIQYAMVANPKYMPNDPKNTQPKQVPVGGYCYDIALARPDVVKELSLSPSLCDKVTKQLNKDNKDSPRAPLLFAYNAPNGHKYVVKQTIDVIPRSIVSIYLYLGRLVAAQEAGLITLFSRDAMVRGDKYLLAISPGSGLGCFASAHLSGESYCVPQYGSDNTKLVFQILTELTNLTTATSDVPTSLSVRVQP